MSKKAGPDLTKYMDKKLFIKLNGNRAVSGTLRGFDQFMNIVLEGTVEEVSEKERNPVGMTVIRGNSIVMMECVEKF
eukprot:CAMPEP_0170166486 /NCGR_PEP_ID=MMETSP0040_2-20121228/135_1 /TAXON_ID=641309 /ORGANISM="Lotharella oceanica, Strain CCMP622" /LENGTH=76 /DNA_ID=CAMNT_0010404211 /DNA_START=31 /DNA_END=261 /DNA_ORIENTATION=+